jgi:hypothetical protein
MNYSVSGKKRLWPIGGNVVGILLDRQRKYTDTCRDSSSSGRDSNRASTEHPSSARCDTYCDFICRTQRMCVLTGENCTVEKCVIFKRVFVFLHLKEVAWELLSRTRC